MSRLSSSTHFTMTPKETGGEVPTCLGVGVQNATTFRCFGVRSSEPASHYQRDQNESKARQVERACWCVGYMSAVPGASRCSGVRWSSFEEVPREQQSVHARSSASEWLAGGTHAFTSVAARGAEATMSAIWVWWHSGVFLAVMEWQHSCMCVSEKLTDWTD